MEFETAIERVLDHEDGYVNDPEDPGGETKWGISKRSYPNLDIKNLTRDEAKQIYKRDFWDVVAGVDGSVRFQVLDAAVNHGAGNAIRMLQRAIDVADDGHWGPNSRRTYEVFKQMRGVNDVLMRFLAHRQKFMIKLKKFDRFGRGWMDRIANNILFAAEDN